MTKFRFYVHTWSPADGHRDRKIIMRGGSMESALMMLLRVLESRETGVIVSPKSYERV